MDSNDKLTNYVSNLDKDIYSVFNLPEEVIATVFAYVSRSPNSFRDNLLKVTAEKAKKFHERWVLNYGHASVAELATVHLGIEKVSRLFSAILERANLYISPIEYSQRYQKPKRDDFYTPIELEDPSLSALKGEYIHFQNQLYDYYLELFDLLKSYHLKTIEKREGEKDKAYLTRIEKTAFEDARYVLSLAVYTNLGLTASGRAMEDTLIHLLSSEYNEVRTRGKEIQKEVHFVLPTLVKYAKENTFIIDLRTTIEKTLKSNTAIEGTIGHEKNADSVKLIDYTAKSGNNPENEALTAILSELLFQYSQSDLASVQDSLKSMPLTEKLTLFYQMLKGLSGHDNPPSAFELIHYKFELLMSESCWHQFLRHRKVGFAIQYPSVDNGYVIPPNIDKAGGKSILEIAIKLSETMFKKLGDHSPLLAHYSVTNAHNRRVTADFTLWELYHLINLRMTAQAQWEIRELVEAMVERIREFHPNLIKPALDRLKKKN